MISFLERPTQILIDFNSMAWNLDTIRGFTGNKKMLVVIKANAYGHGLVEVARFLQDYAFRSKAEIELGVAYIEEAVELRIKSITLPILVMGAAIKEQIYLYIKNNINITVSSIEKLNHVICEATRLKQQAQIHIKIDTGMSRIGVKETTAPSLIKKALGNPSIQINGIYSHFVSSEIKDDQTNSAQLDKFLDVCEYFNTIGVPMPTRHIANSGAIINNQASYLEMVRPGILTYGVYPTDCMEKPLALKPVLSLVSQVSYFKVIAEGCSVSYGATWTADRQTRIATIPIGYGDGYQRALSNRAEVIINGKKFRIVGNICMDQLMVNLADHSAYNGDRVILIGSDGVNAITVEELADKAGTVPHHILTSLNERIPRYYHYWYDVPAQRREQPPAAHPSDSGLHAGQGRGDA